MLFNGHTQQSIDAIDEITMNEIVIMYSDGMVGNQAILSVFGSLTAGVFNYTRAPHTAPFSLKSILGTSYGYIYPEQEVKPSDALLTFMSQAQGFDLSKFKKG
jgi:hypothetical protein